MALTNIEVRNAKSRGKPHKLADEKGLYLLVNQTGKYWRFDYRFAGKRKTLAIGVYPEVTLAEARDKRDKARKLLADSTDPGFHKKAARQSIKLGGENSFEAVAREWFSKYEPTWAKNHSDKIIRRLEQNLFPWLGPRPIKEITAPELLMALRRIESRGAVETAHRTRQNCGQIFRYAIATGRAERDPAADFRGALSPVKEKHHASITEPKAIGELLRAIDGYEGTFVGKCAMQLAPLVFVRPGELRKAEWTEVNLDAAEWRIPAERMKMREQHIVPLSSQAISLLRELSALTGKGTCASQQY